MKKIVIVLFLSIMFFSNFANSEKFDSELAVVAANEFWEDSRFIMVITIDSDGVVLEDVIKGIQPEINTKNILWRYSKVLKRRAEIDSKLSGLVIRQINGDNTGKLQIFYLDNSGILRGKGFLLETLINKD